MAEQSIPDTNALPSAEDLQGMTAEQIAEARATAEAEAADLRGVEPADMTDEQIDRAEVLADHLDAIESAEAAHVAAAEERAERAANAAARLAREPEASDEDETEEEVEETPEAEAEVEAPQAVAAGAARPSPRRPAARKIKQPAQPQAGAVSLIAAADIGGTFSGGQTLTDMSQVTEAFLQRSKAFPQGTARAKNVRHQHSVVTIERNLAAGADGLHYSNKDFKDSQSLLQAAAKETRLSGGSLVAAGGWCAPSETLYGLTPMETLDGIIDLPTVGVDRGGINYTPGPDFADIYTTAGFAQTEAQAIAGTEKACVEVDCPDFSEVRLDAVGYCVKAPLLTRTAYPEVIQRWLEGTIVANQHKVAARLIASMRTALGTALAPTLTGTPITWSTLTMLELVIEGQRQAYRLSEGETLEVIAPRWLRVAIRADFANRAGMGVDRVTNAMIAEHFADRGAAVQWVLNYLELATPLTNVTFPSTVEVMVYPAGTFVRGNADVISLDTVYDTADLQTNVYTAAFVEDGVLLAKMQHGGKRITLPVHVTGQTGALDINQTFGTAQVLVDVAV